MTLINPLAAANTLVPAAATINQRESRDQHLRRDQVVRATVAEGGLERAVLQLGGRKFLVETETPLMTGQKLSLQIVENPKGVELRLLTFSLSDRVRQVLHLAGQSFDLLPLLEELAAPNHPLAKTLSPAAGDALQGALLFFSGQTEGTEGRFLKSLVRVLGLDLEQRLQQDPAGAPLANLKGAVLELLDRVQGQDIPTADRIRRLHQLIEATQIFRARLNEDGFLLLPLPFPFLDYGYLLAERHPRGNGDTPRSGGMLSLYLQLSSIGALNINMLFDQRGLTLRIRTESRQSMAFLEGYRDELEQRLQPWRLAGLNFSSDATAPQQHLVNLLSGGRSTVFDTRI